MMITSSFWKSKEGQALQSHILAVQGATPITEQKRRGVRNMARQIAMDVCREVEGYSHWEIARRLNVGSYSTVSSAWAVIIKRLEKDGVLREQVKKIQERLSVTYGHPAS
jgi:hypothetical protein